MNYDRFESLPERNGRPSALAHARRYERFEATHPEEGDLHEDGFNFWEVVRIVLRRKWMILAITILGVAAAVVLTLRVTPLYKAMTTIEVQREETRIIEGASVDPAVVADDQYMATQYALLQSRSLAERVAEVLNLPSDERYADQNLPRDERLGEAATKIVNNIRVRPEGRSRVINVEFISPYPGETARIANALVENFIQTNLERKYNTTAFARDFVEERLQTTKQALEESERRLVEYAASEDILEIDTEGGGSLDATSIVSLNQELAAAESARIDAEQRYREAQNNLTTRAMLESEDLSRLRTRRSELNAEYQEKLGTFKPGYPEMEQLQARIESIDAEIEIEREAIIAALGAEYNAAQAREKSLRDRVGELRGELQDLRDRRIDYTIIQREVDTNRTQYEALLQRMKEISIASGVGSSQVSIIDRAIVPDAPFKPNLQRSLLQALILSLALGVGLAFALNYIDDTIKSPDDVKNKLGLPAIGVVPKVRNTTDIVTSELADPRSAVSEAFFSTRTALQFTTSSGAPRSLLMTSTRPGEGKTSSTIALAMAFAKIGQRVLIIDADMRKPSFVADSGASIGLSGMLTREADLLDNIVASRHQGLFLLPAGVIPPNPAELLSSPRLKAVIAEAEQAFDIVLVDSPPVLSFTDAPLLGSLCEGAAIIIQSGAIRTPQATRTIGRLMESHSNLLGAILTKFDAKKVGYDSAYYYYSYSAKGAYAYREPAIPNKESIRRKVHLFSDSDSAPQIFDSEN
ncbi:GumC family protein [Henriciella algicola]|uniref:non-specific protein-tyrosine kinase n=1 Tax=Henriciella algicola TaxID=1608422 RepID=A0A399REX9_9PROT|nr:polysaccharide biosynthesis tyrosine autokinase [Henriciella algicola]RIJ29203.1 polysaccharide biosynthesis tyrosine autokinase [Henriciella algicola]